MPISEILRQPDWGKNLWCIVVVIGNYKRNPWGAVRNIEDCKKAKKKTRKKIASL